jgi:hypothetical protein
MSAQVILQSLFNYKASVNEGILAELAKIDPDTHQSEQHAFVLVEEVVSSGGALIDTLPCLRQMDFRQQSLFV